MNIKSLLKEIHSWEDFQIRLLTLSKKQKGDAFELLTKIYFKTDPVYKFYDEVWMLSEVPQKDLDYLELESQDLGIDLIAKNGNEYHAIQCKYHSNKNQSVTFREVSTFTTLLKGNSKLTQGYICSSAISTSRNFDKVDKGNVIKIMSDTWEQLDEEFFKNAHKLLDGKRIKLDPFKPRQHQNKALKEAIKHFNTDNNSRGKLIFPCGAGKSLTGFWMSQELESKSTIIAVPSLSLVKQTLEVYLREIVAKGKSVKWLCICSDEGIGRNDDVIYYTENLGVPCQTDPDYIEKWLEDNRNENKIIFTTYQSGRIIADISKKLNFTFDVGIFDEAHKTVGSDKKLFSHLLFDENISIYKRIFMTATERFYSGSKDDIISMDDEDVYGDTFAQMSFKEAIELGLLTDYKVITIDVKKSEISDFIRDNNLVQLNDKWKKETEARSLASMLALRKAMKQFDIKNAVSFHSSIEKAVRNKELQEYITDTYNYQPIDTYTVSGKQSTSKRNEIVQEFASSSKALITNARCLTEGVDVPNIDCIVFADPRKSKVDIVQALGRALRKKEGKDWGYVILPVVYDDETQEIDNDNFNEILAIVRGLASNDERIVEYFKDKSKSDSGERKERIEQFNFEVFSDYIDESLLSEQLQIKLWDKLSKFNWLPFEVAREFVHKLKIENQKEWRKYSVSGQKPSNIPSAPRSVYANSEWIGYGDWLGTGVISKKYRDFRGFVEARAFVHELKLKNQREWIKYIQSGNSPDDIPSNPNYTYKNKGWISYGDWLGNGFVSSIKREYKQFLEARKFVQLLKIKNKEGWQKYCKSGNKPKDIPSNPNITYKDEGWLSYGDWLGTKKGFDGAYMPFKDAREYVRNLKLKNQKEWRKYIQSEKLPSNVPYSPHQVYKNKGWLSWSDWLGKRRGFDGNYMPFEDARVFAQSLELKSQREWKRFCKTHDLPFNLPLAPHNFYKTKGWLSWSDWLGTKKGFDGTYMPFKDARKYVHNLKLKNREEWIEYSKSNKKPNNIPSDPYGKYKNNGWLGFGDWLGTGTIAGINREFKSFVEARAFVHELKLKNQREWKKYCKSEGKPDDIPSNPNITYKNKGWIGYGDWLGTGAVANQYTGEYRKFHEARNYTHKLKLKNIAEWKKYCKSGNRPNNIPSNPQSKYKDKGWKGWADFLGKE